MCQSYKTGVTRSFSRSCERRQREWVLILTDG